MADKTLSEVLAQCGTTTGGLQLSPEAVQALRDSVASLNNLFKSLIEWATDSIRTATCSFIDLWEIYCRARVPPKWWYMYKHAKKGRVRHKYYNRIMRTVCDKQKNRRR